MSFSHLGGDAFTASEAAEYLEVLMSTFRRYVTNGKLKSSAMGAQVEVWFSHLPLDEPDWDDAIYTLMGPVAR